MDGIQKTVTYNMGVRRLTSEELDFIADESIAILDAGGRVFLQCGSQRMEILRSAKNLTSHETSTTSPA